MTLPYHAQRFTVCTTYSTTKFF